MITEKYTPTATPKWLGYALQSLVFMSGQQKEHCASSEIAENVCSEATLTRRVLSRLVKAGIVEAREGRDGGYALSRKPEDISFADVYKAIQMVEPLYTGLLDTTKGGPFETETRDMFTEVINESERQLILVLERHTIADLIQKINQEK
ncbi:RrF2 family transcriptional regulator [Bacillus horti]|uniref:Rrf2 family protein n=1 Tax=Caldalkalibacillus horti TaxID=77523 RepID=A0ABT9W463_9BACI|nr:Rrf2 family transcriptional regulator [Bacillus horti]MDQ0167882.1 Rrf2 family protein [Bacillus horti]